MDIFHVDGNLTYNNSLYKAYINNNLDFMNKMFLWHLYLAVAY